MRKNKIIEAASDKMINQGFSCAQSIVYGMIEMIREYQDISKEKEEEYINIAGGFGGGVASLRQTCGFTTGSGIGYSLIIKNDVDLLKEKIVNINKIVEEQGGDSQCAKIIENYPDQSLEGRKSQCVSILKVALDYIYEDLKLIYN